MNFDNIELAAAELRDEPWVTPVSMNADPSVRAYLAAARPVRVHGLIQMMKRQSDAIGTLTLEVAAEKQRADMLLEQAQHAAAAVQAEQQRYEKLAQELAAAKAAIPAQTGTPFMYGIMSPDGDAHIDENCVAGDPAALAIEVNGLNDSPDAGFRIVPVYLGAGMAQPVQQPAPVEVPAQALHAAAEYIRDEHLARCATDPMSDYDEEFRFSAETINRLFAVLDGTSVQPVQQPAPVADIEAAAKAVYAHLPAQQGKIPADYPWQDGGNSHMQTLARDMARAALLAAPVAAASVQPELTVWYGAMPESNGKSNFTATLMRKGASLFDTNHFTFERSEYPERVRYDADLMRYLIGEIDAEPCVTNYDADKHSGYVEPASAQPDSGRDAALVESIDCEEFRKLADAYHCVQRQEDVEPTYDALSQYVDKEIERQIKRALAARPANVAQVGELSDAQIDRIATEYAMDGTMLHGSRSLMYARSFARAIIAAMSAPAKTDKG